MKIRKLLKNEYLFSILSRFVSVVISLLQSVLVARYLGKGLQGVNTYIMSITSVGAIVITFGMHQAYPYYRKIWGREKVYDDFLSLVILMYTVFFVIAGLCFNLPLSGEIRAAIFLIPIYGYSKIVAYVCLIEKPNVRNFWWTAAGLLEIVFVFLLWMYTERNFLWAIAILLFCEVFKGIVYTIILRPKFRIRRSMGGLFVKLAGYGFFPMLALLMTTLNYKIDTLMLKQYPYITDEMLGVYGLGIQMAERIIMIPDTLKGVLISKLSKGSGEREVANVCRLSFWASCLMCLAFLALGRWVIYYLYGEEYIDAYLPLVISSFGTVAIGFFKLIAQYNIANKKQILNVLMLSAAIVTDVVFNLLFIPIWGINGAALATGIGNLVCGLVFVIWFSKMSGIPVSVMTLPQPGDIRFLKKIFRRG